MSSIDVNIISQALRNEPWFNSFLSRAQSSKSFVDMANAFKTNMSADGALKGINISNNTGTFTKNKGLIFVDSVMFLLL